MSNSIRARFLSTKVFEGGDKTILQAFIVVLRGTTKDAERASKARRKHSTHSPREGKYHSHVNTLVPNYKKFIHAGCRFFEAFFFAGQKSTSQQVLICEVHDFLKLPLATSCATFAHTQNAQGKPGANAQPTTARNSCAPQIGSRAKGVLEQLPVWGVDVDWSFERQFFPHRIPIKPPPPL